MSAILSFLGGSAFRYVFGEISTWLSKRQDHAHELERMKLQSELEDKAHQRTQDNIRLQHQLGVQMVEVQSVADQELRAADAFTEAVKTAFKPIGIYWVDCWNAIIRPQFAQMALILWFVKVAGQGFIMDDFDRELVCGILGFFIVDRHLGKKGR